MTPPDAKDWWFAVAALSSTLTPLHSASAGQQAGVVTTAAAAVRTESGATKGHKLVLGEGVQAGEVFQTGSEGYVHILFLDQSSLTLGPNSRLRLDTFKHDREKKAGKIVMTLLEGSVRVVGGKNSKHDATEINTPNGKVEVLGGISVVETSNSRTSATFLFGQQMRMSSTDGATQTIHRPGFGVTANAGQEPSAPQRLSPAAMSEMTNRFQLPNAHSSPNQAAPGNSIAIPGAIGAISQSMSQSRKDGMPSPGSANTPPQNVRTQPPVPVS